MRRIVKAMIAPIAFTGMIGVAIPAHAGSNQTLVEAALANPARTDQKDDDASREAEQVLELSGVKAGDKVIDYIPGTGYWTRIFTTIVGPSGHVYALWPASAAKFATEALPALKARKLSNVDAQVQSGNLPDVPEPVDLFWTVQNYHDVANGGGKEALDAFNAAVFKSLKPGGVFMIIDHADAPGSGLSGTSTKHRIDKQAVIDEVEAAGFELVEQSTALQNPQDDHTKAVFDPEIRGKTDKFTLKFRKPA
ncbi:class I SAM-dependent methyltransferase [Novosphingobium profundi]|uniref:class I SAM-dependent methyltransferase n=1 Tax=Novosphingobium profundi TaxID=1774954 RepID=UPI001BD9CA04|nr:methyltransferase [Novosphingobium profundi]MBT0667313.1 class I SAM-dependent methyltransferase [Novosphingobium profundi]